VFRTNRTAKVKFESIIQIWSFIRIYRPSGNFIIYDLNGKILNQFSLSQVHNTDKKSTLFLTLMKPAFWNEIMKKNKIEDTFGGMLERYRIITNKWLPNGSIHLMENQNFKKETLLKAYYPDKNVIRYMIERHEWHLQ